MYEYCAALPDAEMCRGIEPLPGALGALGALAGMRDRVACGLVTGNVEGIARKKMRAVGVVRTGALAPAAAEQRWEGEGDAAFLGDRMGHLLGRFARCVHSVCIDPVIVDDDPGAAARE